MTENELFGNSEQLNDTISRAAVVDAIEGVDWYHQNQHGEMVHGANPDDHQAWYKAEDIYRTVESVPSAQQWISCEERLPKPEEEVLLTFDYKKGRYVETGNIWSDGAPHCYADDYLTPDCRKHRKVVAWMSLPEPWKGEQDG